VVAQFCRDASISSLLYGEPDSGWQGWTSDCPARKKDSERQRVDAYESSSEETVQGGINNIAFLKYRLPPSEAQKG